MSKKKVVFDVALLVVLLIAEFPVITGTAAHEWIGIVCAIVLLLHCSLRGAIPTRFGKEKMLPKLARTVLNALILFLLALCAVSGIMVSGTVLPTFGLYADGFFFWDPLHAFSAKALMALLLVHVALNGRALLVAIRGIDGTGAADKVKADGTDV